LPLGIAAYHNTGGGVFRTMPLTEHAKTHIEILHRFLEIKIDVRQAEAKSVVVEIG
jgi:hypothetical protein